MQHLHCRIFCVTKFAPSFGLNLYRLEQERKKQAEMERLLEKQRQIEQQKEEERRKALEQREVSFVYKYCECFHLILKKQSWS